MTATIISTPHALCNKDGSAHKAKLARLERALQAEYPRASIGLIDRVNVIEVQASERVFFGDGGEQALWTAFREVAAACGY
jgi:hypothetical protein